MKIGMKYSRFILALIAFMAMSCEVYSQKVYSTKDEYQADIKVFVVDKEYQDDLIVFKTDKDYRAKASENKGIWFFTDKDYRADKKIFFVDREYRADLNIFFTDKESRAGWKDNSKKHLLY